MSYLYKSPYCKLCLETSDELIGILSDEGIHLNIDSTLQQHFRFKFEVIEYDYLSEIEIGWAD